MVFTSGFEQVRTQEFSGSATSGQSDGGVRSTGAAVARTVMWQVLSSQSDRVGILFGFVFDIPIFRI
ncbi:hypothetical protein TIFTF001_037337 [Ficus carica]|uniref:Uncharacterized protein n=1 Tax=Ficus carica TaxID=3494 RepID=A0AA88E643_FICCA|nr:hypothetical protein TIFTF001_037337 [Ficus carica]